MVTFDTNVLVYAFDSDDANKRERARGLLRVARDTDLVLTAQVLGEFLNVFRRKLPQKLDKARAQAERFLSLFPVIPSTGEDMLKASDFSSRHKLQFWDSLIWQVAASAGVTALLSEDMQDGLTIDGLTVIDPFNPANAALIDVLLTPMEGIERP